jgi:hypothetical protein
MTTAILQNYLTTLFGILSGLPVIVLGVFTPGTALALDPQWTHILLVTGGVGLVGLGVVSKAFNVHSTTAQTAASQAAALGNPAAPAMVRAADAQVAGAPPAVK